MRYVEAVGARAVVPSAGPPCFLDPDLFHLNVIDGDEPSIFVDQRTFLDRLDTSGHRGMLAVPGTAIDVRPDGSQCATRSAEVDAIFTDKGRYLKEYQSRLDAMDRERQGVVADRRQTSRRHAALVVGTAAGDGADHPGGDRRRLLADRAGDTDIFIDFPGGEVRAHAGEPYRYRFEIERPLVELVVAERAVDWSNSLFLSCRFRAWRDGEFNEWIYNFFKSLSTERMRRTEAEAIRRLHPPTEVEPDIELGDWVVQRRCPHRNADLAVFAEIEDCVLTCTLHGWRFDLETGRCLTAADHPLRVRRKP